jgi:hypothetical protein
MILKFISSLAFIENDSQESTDLRMIKLFYEFLKKTQADDNTCHVIIVTNDSDFQLVLNKMKKYSNVKTHIMTSLIGNYFNNGLADMVLFYERIPPTTTPSNSTTTPSNSTTPNPQKKIPFPPPITPDKKRKNENAVDDHDVTLQSLSKKLKKDQTD